ncbi:MAG: AAA family ATPase [Acidimicrobiia bacterium]|jgi:DNA-binding CsgD family transcriptional regulator
MGWEPPPLPARLSLEGEQPFVGRLEELARIEETWQKAEDGHRQIIFIGGEPGAGKTRLINETAHAVDEVDGLVLYGASSPSFDIPYQPVAEGLDYLLTNTPPGALSNVIPDSARYLGALTQSLTRHRDDLQTQPSGEKEYKVELFNAVLEFLGLLSEDRAVALFIEDLHWAQDPTLQLLTFLAHRSSQRRMMIVASHRTTPPDRSEGVVRTVADVYRLPGAHRIDLGGLDVTEITKLVMARGEADQGTARAEAATLRDLTGGNPFFLRELLLNENTAAGSAPNTVSDAIEGRLPRIDHRVLEVLDTAAVIGDRFDLAVLEAAHGDPATVSSALDASIEAGLIVLEREGEYRFAHAITQQVVYDLIPESRRRELHGVIARGLERAGEVLPRQVGHLARHYARSSVEGDQERAVLYARRAAQHAEHARAFEDAAEWNLAAAEMCDQRDGELILLDAGHDYVRANRFDLAREIYEKVTWSSDPRIAGSAAVGLEDASWRPGLHGHSALKAIDRALSNLEAASSDPLYVTLLAARARAISYLGGEEGFDLAEQALELARGLDDEDALVFALQSALHHIHPRSVNSIERCHEIIDIVSRRGDYDMLALAASVLGGMTYLEGDIEQSTWADNKTLGAVEAGDLTFWRWLVGCADFSAQLRQGQLDQARETARHNLEVATEWGTDLGSGSFGLQMFMVEREAGNLNAVGGIVERTTDLEGVWLPGLLALEVELGELERAPELLDRVVRDLEQSRFSADRPAVLALATEAAVALEDETSATKLLPYFDDYAGFNLMAGNRVIVFGAADRFVAQLQDLVDDPAAIGTFERALELDRRTDAPLHEVETMIAYASHLDRSLDHEDLAKAADLRARARQVAESKGLLRQLHRLDEQTRLRSDRPSGLTPREVAVLRLVAEGLSNREIAEQLFISENTAANHVRRILIKTGSPNRTRAAVYAAQNGLLSTRSEWS